jgi:hypothetical protein
MSSLFSKIMKKKQAKPLYVPREDSFGVALPDAKGPLDLAFLTHPDDGKQLRPVVVTDTCTQFTVKVLVQIISIE